MRRLSATVSVAKTFSVCGTKASPAGARRCAGRAVMSRPPRWTVPLETGTSPAMALIRVLLPAPFGPSTARISPGRSSSETPATIGKPGS